ncbi:BZ3500_MvSof-1268-A1-R1_Chr5-2g07783 [Microbotryum saponariae]|uniref:Autophagy-related protein n=1 Tax=Microbotryum saponariae TaxID=289078 RepID=A0A2X0L9D6_9BASI|nr:BZ3500_MvSof-1268-A1-R1_Chr5-2g07783 [Microbotryum saponariae]
MSNLSPIAMFGSNDLALWGANWGCSIPQRRSQSLFVHKLQHRHLDTMQDREPKTLQAKRDEEHHLGNSSTGDNDLTLDQLRAKNGGVGQATVVAAGGIVLEEIETDPEQVTTRWELWSYYVYYIGNSGLGPFNFGPTQFQNLLYYAGHNLGTNDPCDSSVPCVLPAFGQAERNVSSTVLVANGISFAIQVVIFLMIGSYADYGTWRPWILIFWTTVAIAVSFAWLGVDTPDKWQAATALYIIGLIAYQGALAYWAAAFPRLSRNLPEMQQAQTDLVAGETTLEAFNTLDMMSRNRLSNIAFAVCSLGEVVVLFILAGILYGIKANGSVAQNTRALSIVCAYSAAVWILCALPWFILEKHRPGRTLPPGTNYFTVGFKNIYIAAKKMYKLKDAMFYFAFYFLFNDVLATGVTVISTLQYATVTFDTITLNWLLLVGIVAQGAGVYIFWRIQKFWQVSTPRMFHYVVGSVMLLIVWGMIGNWTTKFGYHNKWEFWLYQVVYGLGGCTWYSYSQTMISEFTPAGHEFLFFSLFTISGKSSSFIGPFVTSAISNRTNNVSASFYFLFALGIVACGILPFLDVERSHRDCAAFIEAEKQELEVHKFE